MNWVVFAILAGFASNAFNFFSRYILKDKDDSTAYAWYFETLRFIIFIVIAVFDWRIILTFRSVILFVLLGLSEFISSYWLMKMHRYSHLSISSILSRARFIWVAVIAFFLVGEKLTVPEYLGIAILFLGLSIIVAPHKLFVDKGATYTSLSAVTIAFNIVVIKMALPFASNSVVNAVMGFPSVFLFPTFMKNARKRIASLFHNNLKLKSAAILINTLSVYLFTIALRLGPASKVTAIYQGMMIVTVLAGIIFLKERKDIARKLIGATITLAGVFLLSVT